MGHPLDMPWPPDPESTDKNHMSMPDLLKVFLQVLLTGEADCNYSQRIDWLVTSLGQDVLYGASRGRIKPPKHILLSFAIKSLTGNVEVIMFLNRMGHVVSYSQMAEVDTALCLRKLGLVSDVGVPLPESMHEGILTTLAYDNIDRLEETLSGGLTSHRVNGIIIQRKVFGPKLPHGARYDVPKAKKRSLLNFIDDRHLPPYNAGAKVGPPVRAALEECDYTDVTTEALKKTFIRFLCRLHSAANDKKNIPSWTGFNIKVNDSSSIEHDNLGYLPTINAPAHCT